MENKALFTGVKDGETFEVAGIEFIKFSDENGVTPVVAKELQFYSSFGENNNLVESKILRRLQEEWLPKVAEAIGEENLCQIQTDLTTLDGLKPYPELESMVSLPTFEFYRKHVEIFDRYKQGAWWWLSTPESAQPHDNPRWVLCVSPSGNFCIDRFNCVNGVRPFLALKSSIFGPFEK